MKTRFLTSSSSEVQVNPKNFRFMFLSVGGVPIQEVLQSDTVDENGFLINPERVPVQQITKRYIGLDANHTQTSSTERTAAS